MSPFRSSITHRGSTEGACSRQGSLTVKLFNLLPGEIGGPFLARGIHIRPETATHFFSRQSDAFWQSCKSARINGQPMALTGLATYDWSAVNGLVSIRLLSE